MNKLREYFAAQRLEGISTFEATLSIPSKIVRRFLLRVGERKKEKDGVYGFAQFDLPLLVSYPRSGTNWIRYFLEVCSGKPTPGHKRHVAGTDYLIDRAHCAYPILKKHSRAILVIRDYKECLLRHNKREWLSIKDVRGFLEDRTPGNPCNWYIKNIKAFDRFKGPKCLVYYDALIHSPETEFRKLGSFFEFSDDVVSNFLNDIEKHFADSVASYRASGHASETSKTRDIQAHARKLLTEEQIDEFDDYFRSNYPSLARNYLSRYFR